MSYLYDWLGQRTLMSPNRTALIDGESHEHYTFAELNARANQVAHFLKEELDINTGDRVAILAYNCIEYVELLFACNKLGAVLQNLNWRLAPPELVRLIESAQPKALIYGDELLDTVHALKSNPSLYPSYFVALNAKDHESDVEFSLKNRCSDTAPPLPNLSWEAPWILCYTGGTTGLPKGVIITLRQMATNTANTVSCGILSVSDLGLTNMPMFHTAGINCFLVPLIQVGGSTVLCKSFDVEQIYDLLERYPVTMLMSAPTGFILMQQHPRWKEVDIGKLRYVVAGGAPCPVPVVNKFREKNANFTLGYGMTEVGPSNFFLPMSEQREKVGAVGYPLMMVDAKLVDEDNCEITDPMQEGELLLRGNHCTPAYWENYSASNRLIDTDVWLHTGDIAMKDKDGAYWILGRRSDMYISGGENIYPLEVESVFYGHPDIAEAAAFGVPDDYWGEVGCTVIAQRAGAQLTDEMMLQFLKGKIATYKIPKYYFFVETPLPKSGAGKIDKKQLKEMFLRQEFA